VLFFAVLRERLGRDHEPLELADGATVAEAIAALEQRHEVVRELRGRYRIAVNLEMTGTDKVLCEGDELVLIPPVAGGADPERHVQLRSDALSLDRVVTAVRSPTAGGLVTFVGMVRDHNRGHDVDHLEYEAYESMAVKVMNEIAAEIEAELPGIRLAVEHRSGRLDIGEVAVVIACAAPHRAEAFTGCRAMIDRLKDRVPIWKKEVGPSGEEWIGLGP